MPLVPISPDKSANPRELILIYGAAGGGKTRFATSLPGRFAPIAYIAFDEGSESLDSVLPSYRKAIKVLRPDNEDPIVDLAEVAHTQWTKQGITTIIIDTLSTSAMKILAYAAKTGKFQKNHVSVGTPGTTSYIALPDKGDYGGTQAIIRNCVTALIDQNPDLHIICLAHQATDDGQDGQASVGGPSVAGKALIEWLPTKFKTIIRLDRKLTLVPGIIPPQQKMQYMAWMTPHGNWIARRNEASLEGNPLPNMILPVDPITFWTRYDETGKALVEANK